MKSARRAAFTAFIAAASSLSPASSPIAKPGGLNQEQPPTPAVDDAPPVAHEEPGHPARYSKERQFS